MTLKKWMLVIICLTGNLAMAQKPFKLRTSLNIYTSGTVTPSLQLDHTGLTSLKALSVLWSQSNTYQMGDIVMHSNNQFYQALSPISADTPWDNLLWKSIGGDNGISLYSNTLPYNSNEVVIYTDNDKTTLYQANENIVPSPFNTVSWTLIGSYIPSTLTINGNLVISSTVFSANLPTQKLVKLDITGQTPTSTLYFTETNSGTLISATLTVKDTAIFKALQLAWDQTNNYQTGDIVFYNNSIYQAKQSILSGVPWTNGLWSATREGVSVFTSTNTYPQGTLIVYNNSASDTVFYQAKVDISAGSFNSASWTLIAPNRFLNGINVQKTATLQSLVTSENVQLMSNTLVEGSLNVQNNLVVSGPSNFNSSVSINSLLKFSNTVNSRFVPPSFPNTYFLSPPTTAGQLAYNTTFNVLMIASGTTSWKPIRFGVSPPRFTIKPSNFYGKGTIGMLDLSEASLKSTLSDFGAGAYFPFTKLADGVGPIYFADLPTREEISTTVFLYRADGYTPIYSNTTSNPIVSSAIPLIILGKSTSNPSFKNISINGVNYLQCQATMLSRTEVYEDTVNTAISPAFNTDTYFSKISTNPFDFLNTLPSITQNNIWENPDLTISLQQASNLYNAHNTIMNTYSKRDINLTGGPIRLQGAAIQYNSDTTSEISITSPIVWLGYASGGTSSMSTNTLEQNDTFKHIGTSNSYIPNLPINQIYVLSVPVAREYQWIMLTRSNASLALSNNTPTILVYALLEDSNPLEWVLVGSKYNTDTNYDPGVSSTMVLDTILLPVKSSTYVFHVYNNNSAPENTSDTESLFKEVMLLYWDSSL